MRFPRIVDLPATIDARRLTWVPVTGSSAFPLLSNEWWIGTDENSTRWLTKLSGSYCAYRENVFGKLAQSMGLACQSSSYLVFPEGHKVFHNLLGSNDRFQLALLFMDEHHGDACSNDCPIDAYYRIDGSHASIEAAERAGLLHIKDIVRCDTLGYLCGQFEPNGRFVSRDHAYVAIDNELMFAGRPCLQECPWHDDMNSRELMLEVCSKLMSMDEGELLCLAATPPAYEVANRVRLDEALLSAKRAAIEYVDLFSL